MYDAVQCMFFGAVYLEPFVKERFTDQGFEDIDHDVYGALDCGLLGKNKARYSLHPKLKVFGKEYIRADSKFKVVFRR